MGEKFPELRYYNYIYMYIVCNGLFYVCSKYIYYCIFTDPATVCIQLATVYLFSFFLSDILNVRANLCTLNLIVLYNYTLIVKKDYSVLLIQLDGNLASDVSTRCSGHPQGMKTRTTRASGRNVRS